MQYDFDKLNNDIRIRNQYTFDKNNILLSELTYATGLKGQKVKDLAHSVCKWETFGIEAINKGLIQTDLKTYFKDCVDLGYVKKEDGWLNESYSIINGVFEHTFSDKFNIVAEAFNSYDKFIIYTGLRKELICTLRIVSKSGGKHSLICYKTNSQLFVSDTSSRGIAEPFEKHINKDNFIYAIEMQEK
jgi:hypothetical protein